MGMAAQGYCQFHNPGGGRVNPPTWGDDFCSYATPELQCNQCTEEPDECCSADPPCQTGDILPGQFYGVNCIPGPELYTDTYGTIGPCACGCFLHDYDTL